MKRAVIDIGSNSIRLLIANCKKDKVVPLYRTLATTRLGNFGKDCKKILSSKAIEKTIAAIMKFKQIAKSYGCKDIFLIATSAVREANNKKDFIDIVRRKTGFDVFVLSGEDEANLSFLGAKKGLNLSGNVLVIDIGGGSTEFSFGKERLIMAKSYPVGAVKLTKSFLKSDPHKKEEIKSAYKYLNDIFYNLPKEIQQLDIEEASIVGVGGTLTSLAAMLQKLKEYDPSRIHNYFVKYSQIEKALYRLLGLKCQEIKNIPGISPERADIITAGVLIIYSIMQMLDFKGIIISESDLMEGFLYSFEKF